MVGTKRIMCGSTYRTCIIERISGSLMMRLEMCRIKCYSGTILRTAIKHMTCFSSCVMSIIRKYLTWQRLSLFIYPPPAVSWAAFPRNSIFRIRTPFKSVMSWLMWGTFWKRSWLKRKIRMRKMMQNNQMRTLIKSRKWSPSRRKWKYLKWKKKTTNNNKILLPNFYPRN